MHRFPTMSWRRRSAALFVCCYLLAVAPVSAQDVPETAEEAAEEAEEKATDAGDEASDAERAAKRAKRRARRAEKKVEIESEADAVPVDEAQSESEESSEREPDEELDEQAGVALEDEGDETAGVILVEVDGVPCVPSPSGAESTEREPDAEGDSREDGEPDAESDSGEDGEPDEAESSDEDAEAGEEIPLEPPCDPERPAVLVFSADADSTIYVDAVPVGRAAPDAPLEVRVKLGEIVLRALSREALGAAWDKTIQLDEPDLRNVRVRMQRAIRNFRREERRSGVYADRKTALMWPRRDNARDVDLRNAYGYCRDLETAGFEDWRLPTLEELRTLKAIWLRATYKILGGIVLSECCIWSSDYDGVSRAKTFNFRYRREFESNAGYELGYRALCVRDWDPEAEDAAREAAALERKARQAEEAAAEEEREQEDAADGR